VNSRFPFVDRVAIATYDEVSDLLKTFVSSNKDGEQLNHYQVRLAEVPSLASLAANHDSRVIDDVDTALTSDTHHTQWLKERDYRSSFTVPLYHAKSLIAFLFFDSKQSGVFDAAAVNFLEVFARLISQVYALQRQVVSGMTNTIRVASGLARIRDFETGQHLERIATYARLMAAGIAEELGLSDEFVEYVGMFASLHDIGKVGIPDAILLKPGQLDEKEWGVMRGHVEIGLEIVERMGSALSYDNEFAVRVMRNIVGKHHERGDGSGYPEGLLMDAIPLEARIVAVADVFDALNNRRPYKTAWDFDAVCRELRLEVGRNRLDGRCVEKLLEVPEALALISRQFADK